MNGKMVIAFVFGALLASGIVYVAVKPAPAPKPAQIAAVAPAATAPQPVTPASPAPTPIPPPAVVAEPAHEKPSPLSPPRHREKPLVARNEIPPAVAPAPPQQDDAAPVQSAPVPAPEPQPVAPAPPPAQPAPAPQPAPAEPPPPAAAPPPVPERVPHTVTIARGTALPVRIGETISTAHNQLGDSFLATLEQPLVVDGFIIAERGARLEGRVTDVEQAGRGRGGSHLSIALVRLATADGQNIRINTTPYEKEGASAAGTDAAKVGGGAAIGAIIGAIAGGGKGAAIGAGAGGAAGAGDVLLTRGQPAEIRVETRLTFRIQDPITITERLD